MQRRSTRLSLQTEKNYAEDPIDELQAGIQSAGARRAGGKKRRSSHDGGANAGPADIEPRAKRNRRCKGDLQNLVEMPLDIILEIFSLLNPLDLLHLARMTKELRSMLMSRSSLLLWKAARANIPGMPDCPEDLSEPQYAHLVFGPACHFCDRKVKSVTIVWRARIRICERCIPTQFKEKTDDWENSYWSKAFISTLVRYMPTAVVSEKSGRRTSDHYHYYGETDAQWKEQYRNAPNKSEWVQSTIRKREKIEKHAKCCETWLENFKAQQEADYALTIEGRKALVVEYVKKLGWGDELSKLDTTAPRVENQKPVLKICRKELTEKSLASLNDFLDSFMKEIRVVRLMRERKAMYKERLLILRKVLKDYASTLPRGSPVPATGGVFSDPRVRVIIEETPTAVEFKAEHLDPIIPLLPEIILRWREEISGQLISLIRRALPDCPFDEKIILNLAITSFYCNSSETYLIPCLYSDYLRFPDVLMHCCATWDPFEANKFQAGSREYYLKEALNEVSWNHRGHINFDPEHLKVLTIAVEMCGLDPKTTTAAQMNQLDPIFECVPCNDERRGRATMKWWGVLVHYLEKHRSAGGMKLVLVNEPEAVTARTRMAEEEQREWSGELEYLVCIHCSAKGNLPSLMRHVKAEHGIRNPTVDDIRHYYDSYYPREVCRLWPPRFEDVEEPSAALVNVS